MKPTIIEFVTDPQLLGLSLSPAQAVLLKAIYGLALDDAEEDCFRACTGRDDYCPTRGGWSEVTVVAGARAGKDSRIAAPIAVYEALFGQHQEQLGRGERAVVPIVAQDLRATRIAFGYVKSYLTESKLLAGEVDEVLASEIKLRNGTSVLCFPCRAAATRGWSIPASVLDEVAFFRLEGSADSDVEIQTSIRRGMLAFPSPRLVKISTPYLKGGLLYEDFRQSFGHNDPHRLVWRAPTTTMNPAIRASALDRERALDPSRYAREYEAEFSEDIDAFLPAAWIEAAVVAGRHELPPVDDVTYTAAIDASGGGADAFTLAVVHVEGEGSDRRVVHDAIRSWRSSRSSTVDLEGVVADAAGIVKSYGASKVVGDKYAGAWVRQAFERHGIRYEDPSMDRSAAYVECEALFAQGRIELLDHPETIRELRNLERRNKPGGRIVVDHPAGARHHDDHANVVALAAAVATAKPAVAWCSVEGPDFDEVLNEAGKRIGLSSWSRRLFR